MILDEMTISLGKKRSRSAELAGYMEKGTPRKGLAAEPEGHLETPYIYDYDTGINYAENDFPVNLDLGAQVDGYAAGFNDSDSVLRLYITVWFEDPDGLTCGENSYNAVINPGVAIGRYTEPIILTKPGTWKLRALLEV